MGLAGERRQAAAEAEHIPVSYDSRCSCRSVEMDTLSSEIWRETLKKEMKAKEAWVQKYKPGLASAEQTALHPEMMQKALAPGTPGSRVDRLLELKEQLKKIEKLVEEELGESQKGLKPPGTSGSVRSQKSNASALSKASSTAKLHGSSSLAKLHK
eukprot:tig00001056_g6631.t1